MMTEKIEMSVKQKDFEYSDNPDSSRHGVAFENAVHLLNSWVSMHNVDIVTITMPTETVSPAIRLWYTDSKMTNASH